VEGRRVGYGPHGLWRSLVSALDWGSRGREFKSLQPDHVGAGQRRERPCVRSLQGLARQRRRAMNDDEAQKVIPAPPFPKDQHSPRADHRVGSCPSTERSRVGGGSLRGSLGRASPSLTRSSPDGATERSRHSETDMAGSSLRDNTTMTVHSPLPVDHPHIKQPERSSQAVGGGRYRGSDRSY
jgi:hypothetical protein